MIKYLTFSTIFYISNQEGSVQFSLYISGGKQRATKNYKIISSQGRLFPGRLKGPSYESFFLVFLPLIYCISCSLYGFLECCSQIRRHSYYFHFFCCYKTIYRKILQGSDPNPGFFSKVGSPGQNPPGSATLILAKLGHVTLY